MLYDLSDALRLGCEEDMTITFPDVLVSLQGSDVNFELVTSSTLRPLKLFYLHHVVWMLRAYVFV